MTIFEINKKIRLIDIILESIKKDIDELGYQNLKQQFYLKKYYAGYRRKKIK